MSNVGDRNTKEYIKSVNTPDFDPAFYVINPDITGGWLDVPAKYRLLTGDVFSVMDQDARDVVDAAEVQAATDADRTANKARIDRERVLKALALVVLDEINILRAEHGLPTRTANQIVGAIKTKIDGI